MSAVKNGNGDHKKIPKVLSIKGDTFTEEQTVVIESIGEVLVHQEESINEIKSAMLGNEKLGQKGIIHKLEAIDNKLQAVESSVNLDMQDIRNHVKPVLRWFNRLVGIVIGLLMILAVTNKSGLIELVKMFK